jgi:ABC-type lipoprotein release transport system permease subunit
MKALHRQKNIIDFTIASLWRRKAKNLALLAAYSFTIFLVASVMFFTNSIKREASFVLQGAPEMLVQRLVAGRHDTIPIDWAERIRAIRGVQSVAPRLWGYYYDATNGANYTLMVNDQVHAEPGTVVVGNGVARNLPAGGNGVIPFKAYDGSYLFLKIKGILPAHSELTSADLIVITEQDFRRLFAIAPGYATDLVLKVRNRNELNTIATKINQLFPDSRPILRDEILSTYDAVFDWRGGLFIVILSVAVLAFVILAWDKATGLSAEERREIGVLKAIGWETGDVLQLKFWEGVVISLSSFLLGVVFAYVHVFFTPAKLLEPAIKGWSVLYPQFRLTPFVDVFHLTTLLFLTVMPYTVATIVPSWRAATIDPDSVMRS